MMDGIPFDILSFYLHSIGYPTMRGSVQMVIVLPSGTG